MVWTLCHQEWFVDNGSYELENVDGSPYLDRINHEKLKKVLDMWFPK